MTDPLRPKPVPPPTPSAGTLSPDKLPGEGRPPMRLGEVRMTDYTRKQLEAVGWKEGDPIPGDLGARLKEILREVNEERQQASLEGSELAAGWKPVQTSFVDIESLPEEKQEEVRQYLQKYKQQVAQEAATRKHQEAIEAKIPPNIQGEQRELMRDQMQQGEAAKAVMEQRLNPDQSFTIDDRVSEDQPAAQPAAQPAPQPSIAQKIETLKREQQQSTTTQDTAEEPPAASVPVESTTCPRCAWPTQKPFEIEITDRDKQAFMVSNLGTQRFEKQYDLFGGNLTVYFRSLTTAETSMIQLQIGSMVRSGEILGDAEYWAHLMEYRLVLSISKIEVGRNVIYMAKPIEQWATENPATNPDEPVHPTPLPRMRDFLYENGLAQETTRRIVGTQHQQFQRLTEALEAMTGDNDFYKGIELPG